MLFRKNALIRSNKNTWKTALISCLAVGGAVAIMRVSPAVYAVDIPTTVTQFRRAPYSRVFFNGKAYMVKDRDFEASDRAIQFVSVWSLNPTNKQLQMAVRYCLPDRDLSSTGAYLTGITLLNNEQPLLAINKEVSKTPAGLKIIRSGRYVDDYDLTDPFWLATDPFWDSMWNPVFDDFDYLSSVYVPAQGCSAGMSRFDVSKLTQKIAQLPNRTLEARLRFSDGRIEDWRLGQKTVEALKELVEIRHTLPTPVKRS